MIDAVFPENTIPWTNNFYKWIIFLFSLAALLFCGHFFSDINAMAQDKQIIGAQEEVLIEPYGIRIPARIDTGAATTSLDARDMKITDNTVSFNMAEKYSGVRVSLPIVTWKLIRTSRSRNRRPVVELDLCIASKRMRVLVNLNDRSRMDYPMIVGRNVLAGNFVVDVSKPQGPAAGCCGMEK